MTDCNAEPLHFSTLGSKTVVADFRGGRLTTDAGALLLRGSPTRSGSTPSTPPSPIPETLS